MKAREAIRKAQEILEQKQRAEEDMLLQVRHFILIRSYFKARFSLMNLKFVEIQRRASQRRKKARNGSQRRMGETTQAHSRTIRARPQKEKGPKSLKNFNYYFLHNSWVLPKTNLLK